MTTVLISDPTLRDGSHAVRHQLTREQMHNYMLIADAAGIPIIEVGHGNGLGASSLQLGESLVRDEEIFELRISSTGRRFHILKATMWNLTDETGTICGQAATFRAHRYI